LVELLHCVADVLASAASADRGTVG
jgi:hypothetical protein